MHSITTALLIISLFILSVPNAHGQTIHKTDTTVYTIVESAPAFPGGSKSLTGYLQAMVRYPSTAQKEKIKGRVFVSFIVEKDGSLTDIRLLKELGYGCDEESIRAVQAMPCWEPGKQSGEPIRVKYYLPIAFGMDSDKRK
ncbi:energy transducer TonB [Spirosoma aerolatum]|uniref:energy transducer TonB n=1 Tax=Spirosoma aerolatum TaxID=1211326 RepID=UPI0009AEC2B5|nr:energy transducer TonB [Spirosoma aerolatum]